MYAKITWSPEEEVEFRRLDAHYYREDRLPDPNTGTSNYRRRGYPPEPLRFQEFHGEGMNGLNERERKIIIEFCHLLEKSKQLFNELRDLPQYGHKQWYTYFERTFDVYTKLWKFQQQHRDILDIKYGLKRWQIGEMASKIGQLYYHFYLRTSEISYLDEAFSFYYAIRGRSYYTKAVREDRSDLMVKKLRFYARFIVVSLLLNKIKTVHDLIKELDSQILDYGNTYDPIDQVEWNTVANEVKLFLKAEPVVNVLNCDGFPILISHRLDVNVLPSVEKSSLMIFSLEDIIIIGGRADQVKFSELTIDMYRILHMVEREPTVDYQHNYDVSPRARNIHGNLDFEQRQRDNPHKFLLYKPLVSQLLIYLSCATKDLPPNGVLLLYISADGCFAPQSSKHPDDSGYDVGGVYTSSRTVTDKKDGKTTSKYKESYCFHPADLFPFTRRPLFLIIDSDNSFAFQNVPRLFGQPMLIFMSPVELPQPYQEVQRGGSLFTLFMYSPLCALCNICDIPTLSEGSYDRGLHLIERFMAEATKNITRSRAIDLNYVSLMGDDFLRMFVLRYIFCETILRLHPSFRVRNHLPRASPPLPEELFEQLTSSNLIADLISHLEIRHIFQMSAAESRAPRELVPANE